MSNITSSAQITDQPLQAEQISPCIISQKEFDLYQAQWLDLADTTSPAEFYQYFCGTNGQQVPFVSWPVRNIVELVSAPGAKYIKAKFLLKPNSDGELRFTIVLFAADSLDKRVSSYYLAADYSDIVAPPVAVLNGKPKQGPSSHNEVANVLVNHWLQSWATNEASPTMFNTKYGVLHGYTFNVNDFLSPLFQISTFGEEEVRLHLALHTYHHTTEAGEDTLAQTLSLAVQLWSPTGFGWDDLIYDLSAPCPPTC